MSKVGLQSWFGPKQCTASGLKRQVSAVRKRAVSNSGWFWQMLPSTEISSKKSFPEALAWQKTAMIFDFPGPQKLERRYIHQNHPFTKPPFCVLSTFDKSHLFRAPTLNPPPPQTNGKRRPSRENHSIQVSLQKGKQPTIELQISAGRHCTAAPCAASS